ncbi:MAG: hypothetical protein ACI3ZT_04545 [Candidatus Cryptobacteroides sp.]
MKFTSRIALFFAGILLSSGIAASQNYVERVKENPAIASGVYHPYHTGNLSDTPAPKGYKPFYISHFGRHGSRYHTLLKYFDAGKDGLEKAARAGILTADGKALQTDFLTVMNEHNGLEGELSPLGAKEHKGVARRMYQRFTPVFNSRSRKEIDCVSSNIRRCIISMANFTESLDDQNPGLDFTFHTGDKYFAYIMKPAKGKTFGKACTVAEDSVRKADCRYDKLFSRLFTDPEKALELIPDPRLSSNQYIWQERFALTSTTLALTFSNTSIIQNWHRSHTSFSTRCTGNAATRWTSETAAYARLTTFCPTSSPKRTRQLKKAATVPQTSVSDTIRGFFR